MNLTILSFRRVFLRHGLSEWRSHDCYLHTRCASEEADISKPLETLGYQHYDPQNYWIGRRGSVSKDPLISFYLSNPLFEANITSR